MESYRFRANLYRSHSRSGVFLRQADKRVSRMDRFDFAGSVHRAIRSLLDKRIPSQGELDDILSVRACWNAVLKKAIWSRRLFPKISWPNYWALNRFVRIADEMSLTQSAHQIAVSKSGAGSRRAWWQEFDRIERREGARLNRGQENVRYWSQGI